MKIKSFILALTLISYSLSAFSQKGELTTAKESYGKYVALRGNKLAPPAITAAKESIDKVTLNAKTSILPETWAYRAQIYADLAFLNEKDDPAKATSYGEEASNAIKKAVELDTKGEFKTNIADANKLLYNYTLNKGVTEFKAAKYTDAYVTFEKAGTYIPGDTTAAYFAGFSAQNAKDYPNAVKNYKNLLNTNYSLLEDVYSNLSVIYVLQKDTASAIKIASEGAKKFPNNTSLITREIEFSLMTGKEKEIISKITEQAQKEPKNKLLPYYLGIAYNSMKDYKKAEEAYIKALEIDPNYGSAAINLGGLIMNSGIDIYNNANKLPASKQKEYAAEKKRAMDEFERAFPYLQKAVDIDPKSDLALKNLKMYYTVKNDTAKVSEIQKKIDAL